MNRSLQENLKDLPPIRCDKGTKLDSKGNKMSWFGYKLHIDTVDGDIPVSAYLSSASLHDSQVAIPLSQISETRLKHSCYELMDAAYDAKSIKDFIHKKQRVPIIDPNKRRKAEGIQLEEDRKIRLRHRSSAERVNSVLKERFMPSTMWVKGPKKVYTHLMFGILSIAALRIYKQLC